VRQHLSCHRYYVILKGIKERRERKRGKRRSKIQMDDQFAYAEIE